MTPTISCPSVPFIEPLPCALSSGNLIRITGNVCDSATCFAINLQNGSSTEPRSDIALHLSPVFSPPPRLVRNSLENQSWGPEESHGSYFPFKSGEKFEILILVESDHFKIAINGQHFAEFHYRLPLHAITHIAVDGDVNIYEIKFEGLSKSPVDFGSNENMSKPLGFVIDSNNQANLAPPAISGRPPSPYDASLPYPSNPSFGPSPTSPTDPYSFPTSSPYGPPPQSNLYPSGRISPSPYGPPPGGNSPYGPPPGSNPYGPPVGTSSPYGPPPGTNNPYGPSPGGGYPYSPQQGYPQQPGSYPQGYFPNNPYPSQPGPYPGTTVVYPGQEKKSSGGFDLGPLATAGAAALAGAAGSALIGGKKHKKHKHGYGIPGMSGAGPASLIGGVGSLLSGSGNKHGGHSGSSIPMGGALAGGAAALAGAYMLNKSPMGKMMKPKKMKKMYKGGWGSSSSSSSSSDEE